MHSRFSSNIHYLLKSIGKLSPPAWDEEVKSRTIDYNGDEGTHALPIVLAELIPGLPRPGVAGKVLAEELAGHEVSHWLHHPAEYLLPRSQWPESVPKAKVQVNSDSEYLEIVRYCVNLGIFEFIDYDDIFSVDGVKVLNGLFAVVKKGEVPAGLKRITRLIMNMIPGNSYQQMLSDSLGTLSSSTSWTSIALPSGRVLLWSSDDQKGAFYTFRLPSCWRPFMAF